MKRRGLAIVVLLFAVPFLVGMGVAPDGSPEKIPVPAKKFHATFVDQADMITDCHDVSIEGRAFLDGRRGEGLYTVAFDNIREVVFRQREGKLLALVRMQDGTAIELAPKKDHKAYGHTRWGTFQIKLGDLKKMILVR